MKYARSPQKNDTPSRHAKTRALVRAIARELGRAPSTISREMRRNAAPTAATVPSRPAHRTPRPGADAQGATRASAPKTWEVVERYLRLDWSPEQVSGFLRAEGSCAISHETIYVHVWHDKARGGDLWTHLRQASKKRRKRYGAYDSRGRLAGKRHISERPPEVEDRRERRSLGDRHGDGHRARPATACSRWSSARPATA